MQQPKYNPVELLFAFVKSVVRRRMTGVTGELAPRRSCNRRPGVWRGDRDDASRLAAARVLPGARASADYGARCAIGAHAALSTYSWRCCATGSGTAARRHTPAPGRGAARRPAQRKRRRARGCRALAGQVCNARRRAANSGSRGAHGSRADRWPPDAHRRAHIVADGEERRLRNVQEQYLRPQAGATRAEHFVYDLFCTGCARHPSHTAPARCFALYLRMHDALEGGDDRHRSACVRVAQRLADELTGATGLLRELRRLQREVRRLCTSRDADALSHEEEVDKEIDADALMQALMRVPDAADDEGDAQTALRAALPEEYRASFDANVPGSSNVRRDALAVARRAFLYERHRAAALAREVAERVAGALQAAAVNWEPLLSALREAERRWHRRTPDGGRDTRAEAQAPLINVTQLRERAGAGLDKEDRASPEERRWPGYPEGAGLGHTEVRDGVGAPWNRTSWWSACRASSAGRLCAPKILATRSGIVCGACVCACRTAGTMTFLWMRAHDSRGLSRPSNSPSLWCGL